MTTTDLDRLLAGWMEQAEPVSEPATLLPSVFAVTRTTGQRRGVMGRVAAELRYSDAFRLWEARPVLTYVVLGLLILALLAVAAVAGGFLRPTFATGWRQLDADPKAGEYTAVSAIVANEDGFLAIGHSELPLTGPQCTEDLARGRVWSSPHGDRWTELAVASLVGVRIQRVVVAQEAYYAFGHDDYCGTGEEQFSAEGWRSRDGVGWAKLPASEMLNMGNIPNIVDLDGELISVGIFQAFLDDGGYGPPEARVWASNDGSRWDHVGTIPGFAPGELAEKDGTLVLIAWSESDSRARLVRSTDAGRSWEVVASAPAIPDELYSIVAGHDVFVAVGNGAAVTSSDGRSWTAATVEPGALDGVFGLWSTPSGFMAARGDRSDGGETLECGAGGLQPARPTDAAADPTLGPDDTGSPPNPSDYCVPVDAPGGTGVSRDGTDWRIGPDLPAQTTLGRGGQYVVGAGRGSLLVAEPSHSGAIWYAPLADFSR